MHSAKRPTEAIARLLAEELREVIRALPKHLQRSVPEELQGELGTLGEEDSTGKDR
jgi:hypothetical protein